MLAVAFLAGFDMVVIVETTLCGAIELLFCTPLQI